MIDEELMRAESPIKRELYVNDDGCSCVINTKSRVVTTREMCPAGCRVVRVEEQE